MIHDLALALNRKLERVYDLDFPSILRTQKCSEHWTDNKCMIVHKAY
jgi:hypothetical protein